MKAIFHIGMHKTGTSSIQKNLQGYTDKNYMYPNLIRGPNHSTALMTAFRNKGDPKTYNLFKITPNKNNQAMPAEEKVIKLITEELISEIEKAKKNKKNLIFSGEDLSRINQRSFDKFINFFDKYIDEFIFVIYIREPKSWMKSAFLERLKMGSNLALNNGPCYFDLEKFINADCNKKIIFREFSSNKLFKGDAVADFFNIFKLKQPNPISQDNISPNLEIAKCRYFLTNNITEANLLKIRSAFKNFSTFLNELELDDADLDKEVFAPICSLCKQDIVWAEKVTGIDLGSNKYTNPFENSELQIDFTKISLSDETILKLTSLNQKTRDLLIKFVKSNSNKTYSFSSDRELVINVFLRFFHYRKLKRFFICERYLELNPDIKKAGVDPAIHFCKHGIISENREY